MSTRMIFAWLTPQRRRWAKRRSARPTGFDLAPNVAEASVAYAADVEPQVGNALGGY